MFLLHFNIFTNLTILICRMAQFHLLDPHYDEHHKGRLTAEGRATRPRRRRVDATSALAAGSR
jgi:hypothetical protein